MISAPNFEATIIYNKNIKLSIYVAGILPSYISSLDYDHRTVNDPLAIRKVLLHKTKRQQLLHHSPYLPVTVHSKSILSHYIFNFRF